MPSIGLDMKPGRGWGTKRHNDLRSVSMGCVSLWWVPGTVAEMLEQNSVALVAARDELQVVRDRQDVIAKIVWPDKG